jgi:uncharacterized paraquat-inducible protein A
MGMIVRVVILTALLTLVMVVWRDDSATDINPNILNNQYQFHTWACPMGDYAGPDTADGKCPKCGMRLMGKK